VLLRRYPPGGTTAVAEPDPVAGSGIGGVSPATRLRLKCLHPHAAHALARPRYRLGREVLEEAGELWCADERCRETVATP